MKAKDVKKLRAIMGLKQKELAEKIGVSIGTVQNYESGGVIPPAKQKLLRRMLDEACNVISENAGSINTGNVGGHNISIVDPSVKKIIDGGKVQIDRDLSAENYQRIIDSLNARIVDLERIIEAKDALIKVLQKK